MAAYEEEPPLSQRTKEILDQIESTLSFEEIEILDQYDTHSVEMVISSGKNGVEFTALIEARKLKIPTGGIDPHAIHFMTRQTYSLKPHPTTNDPAVIMRANIDLSNGVLLFIPIAMRDKDCCYGYCHTGQWKPSPLPDYDEMTYSPSPDKHRPIFCVHPEEFSEPYRDGKRLIEFYLSCASYFLKRENITRLYVTGYSLTHHDQAWNYLVGTFLQRLLQ